MPSGPPELHAKFGDDSTALELLEKAGYTYDKSFTIRPPVGHKPTTEELDAINYLILEWDWGYNSANLNYKSPEAAERPRKLFNLLIDRNYSCHRQIESHVDEAPQKSIIEIWVGPSGVIIVQAWEDGSVQVYAPLDDSGTWEGTEKALDDLIAKAVAKRNGA